MRIACVAAGLVPACVIIFVLHWLPVSFCWLMLAPVAVMFLLALLMRR